MLPYAALPLLCDKITPKEKFHSKQQIFSDRNHSLTEIKGTTNEIACSSEPKRGWTKCIAKDIIIRANIEINGIKNLVMHFNKIIETHKCLTGLAKYDAIIKSVKTKAQLKLISNQNSATNKSIWDKDEFMFLYNSQNSEEVIHAFSHYLMRKTFENAPDWALEGIAQIVAAKFTPQKSNLNASNKETKIDTKKRLPFICKEENLTYKNVIESAINNSRILDILNGAETKDKIDLKKLAEMHQTGNKH